MEVVEYPSLRRTKGRKAITSLGCYYTVRKVFNYREMRIEREDVVLQCHKSIAGLTFTPKK